MIFRRKKPSRLYYPTKSRWYRRPRRKPAVRSPRRVFSHNIRTHFSKLFKDFFLYVFAGAVFLGLIIFLLFSSKFSIANIEVARDDLHIDSGAVTSLLADARGQSIFFFSKSKAKRLIHEKYPEFEVVEVRKLLPNTIKVELKTHDIVANIRAYYILPEIEEAEQSSENEDELEVLEALNTAFALERDEPEEESETITPIEQRALLNRIGQAIFDREEDLELMTFQIDGLSQPIQDREVVIPAETMEYTLNAIRYLTNLNQIEVKKVRYLTVAREIHLETDKGFMLWLSTELDYKEQLDRFHQIYNVADLDQEELAYIDLRIREKVIYCPRYSLCDQ